MHGYLKIVLPSVSFLLYINYAVCSEYLPTTLAGKVKQIDNIRPSVRPFVSSLSFEPTDLLTRVFIFVWIMMLPRLD